MLTQYLNKIICTIALCTLVAAQAARAETIKIGVLKFGTVNWVMDVIEHNAFDTKNGFELEVVPFANGEASTIAFQAGELDVFVDDWTWVSSQRAAGKDFVLSPYSAAVGALMVPNDSPVKTLADVKNLNIGIAGGPVDKNLLLLRALAQQKHGFDLADANELAFGSPPLLAEKAVQGELDAVLNFWHYCARLEGEGFREVIGANEAAVELGANEGVAMLGYVFRGEWANANKDLINGFLQASRDAQALLDTSDAEWERIRENTKAKNDIVFEAYKRRFRAGIPRNSITEEIANVEAVYPIVAEYGGRRLVGEATELAKGTYWPY